MTDEFSFVIIFEKLRILKNQRIFKKLSKILVLKSDDRNKAIIGVKVSLFEWTPSMGWNMGIL